MEYEEQVEGGDTRTPGVSAATIARAAVLLERAGIDGRTKVHSVTKQHRRTLLSWIKCFPVDIAGPRPVEEAIVTSGGIKVSEINPTTLESKKAPGVYFAGEVLDVDAYTGATRSSNAVIEAVNAAIAAYNQIP